MKISEFLESFLATAVMAVIDGFVVKCLWAMFVIKFFHQPVLPFTVAIGLCVLVSYMAVYLTPQQMQEHEPWSSVLVTLLRGSGALLVGFAIFLFTL